MEGRMRGAVRVVVGLAAAGVIGAVPAAEAMQAGRTAKASKSAKARRAGTSYFGATSAGGGVAILLSRDRRQVRRSVFAYQTTCTDGSTFSDWDGTDAIPISAAGKFNANFDSGPQTSANFPGETRQLVTSISGVINKRGSKIVGTARVTFMDAKAVGSFKCDTGLIQFTAND
jgi:hypothetical protein